MTVGIKEKIALGMFLLSSLSIIVLLLTLGFSGPTGFVVSNESDYNAIVSQSNEKSCVDSDGSNSFLKGSVTYCENGECTLNSDSCSGKTLTEFSCENGERVSSQHLCEFDCDSGSCVNKITLYKYDGDSFVSGGGSSGSSDSSLGSSSSNTGQTYDLGVLDSEETLEVLKGDSIKFSVSGTDYTATVQDSSNTQATLSLNAVSGPITITVGNTQLVDLDSDEDSDISITVRSINIISKKVKLILSP